VVQSVNLARDPAGGRRIGRALNRQVGRGPAKTRNTQEATGMPVSPKTKAVAGLAMLDIARQVATAWSAKHQAQQQRIGFGHGLREDVRSVLRDAKDHAPELHWSMPPWRREPTFGEKLRTWSPVAVVVLASTAAVIVAARVIARRDAERSPEETVTDSKVVGAVRAGSQAIDAGVTKVVNGSTGAAAGTASAIAAGSSAVRSATVERARVEVDQRVVQPAKRKAVLYGTMGAVGLTAYVILIAVVVQLVVVALS
jgi:hypothetical protein